MAKQFKTKLSTWMFIGMIIWAIGQAIIVAVAGLALNLPIRSLWFPYGLLFYSGLIVVATLYWALQAYDQPKTCAVRFAVVIFFSSTVYAWALAYSIVRLDILPFNTIIDYFAPCILPGAVFSSAVSYGIVRRRLDAPKPL